MIVLPKELAIARLWNSRKSPRRYIAPNPLASLVRTYRNDMELTQAELSELIGASSSYISQIEAGRITWPSGFFWAIAHALGISVLDVTHAARLAKGYDDPPNIPEDIGGLEISHARYHNLTQEAA